MCRCRKYEKNCVKGYCSCYKNGTVCGKYCICVNCENTDKTP